MDKNAIADRIFSLLDQTDMEQQEFAKLVGVSDDTASNWRRYKSASFTKHLTVIAGVLKTTPAYLLTGEEKNLPAPGAEGGQLGKLAKALADEGVDLNGLADHELRRLARMAAAAFDR